MNIFILDPNFVLDFSYLQELEELPSEPTGAFSSQPNMSGYSVQTLRSPFPACVSQSGADQNSAYSVNALNQYVVAPSTTESNFISNQDCDEMQLEELLGTNETASDELMFTEPNSHNVSHSTLQESCFGETSVNFSQPESRLVAKVGPLNKDTQQQVTTETVELKAPESSGSNKPLPIRLAEIRKRKAYQKAYHNAYNHKLKELVSSDIFDQAKAAGKAAYRKAYHKAYNDKLKELVSSDIFDQAKAAGKAAGKAEIKRVIESSASVSGESLTITLGEVYSRAYNRAYNRAYRAEKALSGDEVKAKHAGRAAGRAAGQAERERVKASSASFSDELLPPSFQSSS